MAALQNGVHPAVAAIILAIAMLALQNAAHVGKESLHDKPLTSWDLTSQPRRHLQNLWSRYREGHNTSSLRPFPRQGYPRDAVGVARYPADSLFIVRFTSYRMAAEHRSSLKPKLSHLGWTWIDRQNAATKYPTDFGLVRAEGASLDVVKGHLELLEGVKDVHPEKMVALSLKHAEEPTAPEAVNSFGNFLACEDLSSDPHCVRKRPGRLLTRPTFSLEENSRVEDNEGQLDGGARLLLNNTSSLTHRRRLAQGRNLPIILGADTLWALGHSGKGVKMGVFDTGIKGDHPDVKNIVERTNWTHEPTLEDGLGHGSFVAGVVAGTSPSCPGLAPDVSLHTFRVFTNDQVSFTSWFLDAFNYAIASEMDIVNLSIGGPDYLDRPFVEKVWEVTGAGIIMISAIGNDGPLYGTLNNPADQNDVVGVGGIDYDNHIAGFSSRGMSTWELPLGYGRSKPDIMAYGKDVQGSRIEGGCRALSGTSVASPVVAGAVCLLASTLPAERRGVLNPASMKQALVEGAKKLPGLNMYEQGQGRLDVLGAHKILETYSPRASIVPSMLNFTECPYAWPFCSQPLYAGAMPLMFNATVLNGMGVVGELEGDPVWTPVDEGGRMLDVRFDYPSQLWPWSGHLALFLRVRPEGAEFEGRAHGSVTFAVVSPPAPGEMTPRRSEVTFDIIVDIIPTPPRSRRVLWDQFHSLRYPPAYFPRDDLSVRHDILDWHGDHPHTNFHVMYDHLRSAGYFLEVLASPATCFDARSYGALLIVDSEDEFYPEEIKKLERDVRENSMGLLVFADWYELDKVREMRFFDDNTRSWWDAATGGANIPALNDLLAPLGAAFAGGALNAEVESPGDKAKFSMRSGSALAALPAGAWMYNATVAKGDPSSVPVLGFAEIDTGRLVLYGDSNCLDSSHQRSECFGMLEKALAFATEGDTSIFDDGARLESAFGSFEGLPQRRDDYNFTEASFVKRNPLRCYSNSPLESQKLPYLEAVPIEQATTVGGQEGFKDEGVEKAGLETDETETSSSEQQQKAIPRLDEGTLRDIAHKQGEQQPVVKIVESKRVGGEGGSGSSSSSIDIDTGHWNRFRKLPSSLFDLPLVFSVSGGVALVVLWSVARRRRRRLSLPMFWRRTINGRQH